MERHLLFIERRANSGAIGLLLNCLHSSRCRGYYSFHYVSHWAGEIIVLRVVKFKTVKLYFKYGERQWRIRGGGAEGA